jgi:hypothetical protein
MPTMGELRWVPPVELHLDLEEIPSGLSFIDV